MGNTIANFILSIIMAILSIFGIGTGGGGHEPIDTTPTGYDIMSNVSYGTSSQQAFDLMIPEGIGKTLSLAVYIHGGAWMGGDKSLEIETFTPMAKEKGMIAASLNYRLLKIDDASLTLNDQLQDINSAITKIVQICTSKGYKIKKALIWGESAGAHLALMYSYTWKDRCPVDIGLCYSICGPTNLCDPWYYTDDEIPPYQMLILQSRITGLNITADNLLSGTTVDALRRCSPINYVNAGTVPTIFNSCGRDTLVPVSNGEDLAKILKANFVDYYYVEFPNSNHCGRNGFDSTVYTKFDKKLDQMINTYVK